MKKHYLLGLFALAISLIHLTAVSGETCEERRATTGTLFSNADAADTTPNLDDAGYVATFNGLSLPLLDNTEIPVGSTYVFEISHSNPEMQGLLEFELDWSSMVHSKFVVGVVVVILLGVENQKKEHLPGTRRLSKQFSRSRQTTSMIPWKQQCMVAEE